MTDGSVWGRSEHEDGFGMDQYGQDCLILLLLSDVTYTRYWAMIRLFGGLR